jgi:hypothetical protein
VIEGEARLESAIKIFEDAGVSAEDVKKIFRIFSANYPDILEVKS